MERLSAACAQSAASLQTNHCRPKRDTQARLSEKHARLRIIRLAAIVARRRSGHGTPNWSPGGDFRREHTARPGDRQHGVQSGGWQENDTRPSLWHPARARLCRRSVVVLLLSHFLTERRAAPATHRAPRRAPQARRGAHLARAASIFRLPPCRANPPGRMTPPCDDSLHEPPAHGVLPPSANPPPFIPSPISRKSSSVLRSRSLLQSPVECSARAALPFAPGARA